MNLRLFLSGFLVLICLPVLEAYQSKVTTHDLSFTLPEGWEQIENPKVAFCAAPHDGSGRFFAIVVESSSACPIPCDVDSQTGYEKGFWNSFNKTFQTSSHSQMTSKDFQVINGVPFQILNATREANSDGTLYLEIASTPGNGNMYELLLGKRGGPPGEDVDIQALMQSVAFVEPLRLAWYQPWLHEADNITGLPLLLVAIGLGIYLLTILKRPEVSQTRKINIAASGFTLSMLNGYWIAGLSSTVGIISFLLFGAFILLMQPLVKKQKALIAEGKAVGPTRLQLKKRFWILIGSFLLGVLIANFQFMSVMGSAPMLIGMNVFLIGMFGTIFWVMRKNFFPKADSTDEPKA